MPIFRVLERFCMSNIYKQSLNRKQQIFFPPSIDEYVSEDNPVRAIDDYVELLDMVKLGFTKSALNLPDGQPAYHPKLLLKIYIYGYLNKIRSSIVEHPFGTIKQTLGWSHFLVRGKEKVSGENALIMFTYNFRRLLNLIGITLFRKLLNTLKDGNIEEIKAEIVAYIAYFRLYLNYFFRIIFFLDFRWQKWYYCKN